MYERFFPGKPKRKNSQAKEKVTSGLQTEKENRDGLPFVVIFRIFAFGMGFPSVTDYRWQRDVVKAYTTSWLHDINRGRLGREVYGRSTGGLQTRPPVLKLPVHRHLSQKREVSAENQIV